MLTKVISCERIALDTYDMRLSGEFGRAAPGSFLHIKCGPRLLLRRPISLCAADESTARIVFAVKGEGTAWLSVRKAGDALDALGPLGHGFCVDDVPTLLVGGGIGVPPMLCCDRALMGKTHAILGFRSSQHACLYDEFRSCEVVTDDGSLGRRAYPHEVVAERLREDKGWRRVFACGPAVMMRAVAREAAALGAECFVSLEERMGCGVGACLVCACAVGGQYRHVCKDGPVFDAKEVDWHD